MRIQGRVLSVGFGVALGWWQGVPAAIVIALASTLPPSVARAAVSKPVFQSEAKLEKVGPDAFKVSIRLLDVSGLQPVAITSPRILLRAGQKGDIKTGDDARGAAFRVLVHEDGRAATVVVTVIEQGRHVWTSELIVELAPA